MQKEIPLTQKVYDFYSSLYILTQKMPKKDKYSLGIKIDQTTLDLLEIVIAAGNAKPDEKLIILQKASAKTDLLKLLIRLCYDIKAIDKKKYLKLEERLQEIGRMLGGWIKSLR